MKRSALGFAGNSTTPSQQPSSCNSSRQDEQEYPSMLVQMAQWIANHSAFSIHFMP